jgi:hypothetical protein
MLRDYCPIFKPSFISYFILNIFTVTLLHSCCFLVRPEDGTLVPKRAVLRSKYRSVWKRLLCIDGSICCIILDLEPFGRIILKLILKGCGGRLWTGFAFVCFEVKTAVFWAWQWKSERCWNVGNVVPDYTTQKDVARADGTRHAYRVLADSPAGWERLGGERITLKLHLKERACVGVNWICVTGCEQNMGFWERCNE